MIKIGNMENRFTVLFVSLIMISVVSYLDYITGSELSFSFFYIIPISFLALYKRTSFLYVLISTVFASVLWFWAENSSRYYSSIIIVIWNAFVRFVIFTLIGALLIYLKEKQKQLDLLNKNLISLNQEKNKFIGIAAHDLRNPIAGIHAYSENLIDDFKEKVYTDILEMLNMIKQLSGDTLTILGDLLDISKIESGKVELDLKFHDYVTFIKHKIEVNQILAKHKNIVINLHSDIDTIFLVYDESHLSGVIDNLLSNAIKYSKINSEILVKISLFNNVKVLTEVIDQGIGIPLNEQQKLFDYFQTTSSRPTAGEKSTGLGLAIAKQMIKLHQGEIGVKSEQNNGSTFYYTLPIKTVGKF